MRVDRCDNCGRENVHAYRFAGEAREAAHEANRSWLDISVEAYEDTDHMNACSWACLAQLALTKAATEVTG